jgi:hypothetical protein
VEAATGTGSWEELGGELDRFEDETLRDEVQYF